GWGRRVSHLSIVHCTCPRLLGQRNEGSRLGQVLLLRPSRRPRPRPQPSPAQRRLLVRRRLPRPNPRRPRPPFSRWSLLDLLRHDLWPGLLLLCANGVLAHEKIRTRCWRRHQRRNLRQAQRNHDRSRGALLGHGPSPRHRRWPQRQTPRHWLAWDRRTHAPRACADGEACFGEIAMRPEDKYPESGETFVHIQRKPERCYGNCPTMEHEFTG